MHMAYFFSHSVQFHNPVRVSMSQTCIQITNLPSPISHHCHLWTLNSIIVKLLLPHRIASHRIARGPAEVSSTCLRLRRASIFGHPAREINSHGQPPDRKRPFRLVGSMNRNPSTSPTLIFSRSQPPEHHQFWLDSETQHGCLRTSPRERVEPPFIYAVRPSGI